MTTEDRRVGKLLPIPVVPETTVCFTIVVPNAVQYRAALLGQLSILGDWHTWDHPTDGTVCSDCEQAAQLWRNALYNAVWSEECPEPMSCEDIADCIETDEAVQAAIAQQVQTNPAIVNNVYNTTVVGTPMTSSQRGTSVSSTTGCDPDVLFGSVTSIVDQLDQNNRDFLEVIQLTDNAQQRLSKIIKAIPLLNEVPIDEALDFASQLSTEIKENYDAQWTTAIQDEYRCDLFCIARNKAECELTFQDMVVYWNDRIGTGLEPINFFQALVTYFTLGTWTGTTVIDIMMLIQLSVWQQASEWTGITLRTLETVGLLGANNPDPDWNLLCDECSEQDGCWDFLVNDQGVVPLYSSAPNTNYVPGQGRKRDDYRSRPDRCSYEKRIPVGTLKNVTLIFNEPLPTTTRINVRSMGGGITYKQVFANGTSSITISGLTNTPTNGINIEIGNDAPPGGGPNPPISATFRVEGTCWEYV